MQNEGQFTVTVYSEVTTEIPIGAASLQRAIICLRLRFSAPKMGHNYRRTTQDHSE